MTKEERLTQLRQEVSISNDAVLEVFHNVKREGAGKFISLLDTIADKVAKDNGDQHLGSMSLSYFDEASYPNVVFMLAEARESDICRINSLMVDYRITMPMSVTAMGKFIGETRCGGMMPVVDFSDEMRLFQTFEGGGLAYVPKLFQRVIDKHGANDYRIMRVISATCENTERYYTAVSLEDILSLYGIKNPEEYTNKDTPFSDRLAKAWADTFQNEFVSASFGLQKAFFENKYFDPKDYEDDMRNFLLGILDDPACEEVLSLVYLYYERQADAAGRNSEKEVEPAASGTSSSLEFEDVQAVLCTLESVDHTDSIPALNRPRYIGWFKTIQDAVDFVTYELDNSPMYKNVESVEKKILENGDIEATINSVVKLVYHFELIQK